MLVPNRTIQFNLLFLLDFLNLMQAHARSGKAKAARLYRLDREGTIKRTRGMAKAGQISAGAANQND